MQDRGCLDLDYGSAAEDTRPSESAPRVSADTGRGGGGSAPFVFAHLSKQSRAAMKAAKAYAAGQSLEAV